MECEDSEDNMQETTGEMMRWNTDILSIQKIHWPNHGIIDLSREDYLEQDS